MTRSAGTELWHGQVLFALHPKTLLSGMELDGVTTRSVEPIHTGSSKVDIFLELFEAADESVVGHIEYDSSLWQRSSIVALAAELNVRPLLVLCSLHAGVSWTEFVAKCLCLLTRSYTFMRL